VSPSALRAAREDERRREDEALWRRLSVRQGSTTNGSSTDPTAPAAAGEPITLTVSLNALRDVTPASPAAPGTPGTAFVPYRPPVVARVDPRVGPSIGGTRITVTGAFFTGTTTTPGATPAPTPTPAPSAPSSSAAAAAALLKTSCLFGTVPSPEPAQFVSASRIVCVSPPSPMDAVEVVVTNNGLDTSPATGAGAFSFAGCAPGSFSPGFPTPCALCAPGSFTAQTAATNCTLCGQESYQPDSGATGCVPCPAMSVAFPGADRVTACQCARNFYRPGGAAPNAACVACPSGGACGATGIVAQPGYFKDPSDPDRFLRCSPASVCDAGGCREGHTGFMCRSCLDGYYHQGLLCERCPGQSTLLLVAVVAVGIISVITLLALAGPTMATYSATLLIVASHCQTVAVSMNIELGWPKALKDMRLAFTSVYTLDFSVPECSMGLSWSTQWLLSLAAPFIFALALGAAWLVVRAHSAFLRRNKPPGWSGPSPEVRAKSFVARVFRTPAVAEEWNTRTVNAFVLFAIAAYLPLCREALSFFACTSLAKVGDDGSAGTGSGTGSGDAAADAADATTAVVSGHVLDVNGEHLCFSTWWYSRLGAAVAGVLLYVIGIPVLCVTVFVLRRRARGAPKFTNALGAVYRRFDRTVPYWETVVCLRKVAVVVATLFLSSCPLCQVGLAVLVLINAGLIHAYVRPYSSPRHNALEAVGLGTQVLILLAGISYSEGDLNDSGRGTVATVTGALIAIGAVSLPFVWAYDARRPYVPKKRARRQDPGAGGVGGGGVGGGGGGGGGGNGGDGGAGKKARSYSAAIGISAAEQVDDGDDAFDNVMLTDAAFGASLTVPGGEDAGRPSTGDFTDVKVKAKPGKAAKAAKPGKKGKDSGKSSGKQPAKKAPKGKDPIKRAGADINEDIDLNLDDMFGAGAEDAGGGIVGSEMGGGSFL
jgi:hypothetical protein